MRTECCPLTCTHNEGTSSTVDLTQKFNMRMSPDEVAMMRELAEEDGISASDLVRQLIRRTYAKRHGAVRRSAKPKRGGK